LLCVFIRIDQRFSRLEDKNCFGKVVFSCSMKVVSLTLDARVSGVLRNPRIKSEERRFERGPVSAQLIELLLFAGVAFFLVSKLLSVLGTTNENDGKSFFGEPAAGGMKDVTAKPVAIEENEFADILAKNTSAQLAQNINVIADRLPSFDIRRFADGSKSAFKMIIEALVKRDIETLNALVDKRFLEQFETSGDRYGIMNTEANLDAKVSEGYMFGNNAFVKILFTGNKITSKIAHLKEEWTFIKNVSLPGPDWHLSNVEVL